VAEAGAAGVGRGPVRAVVPHVDAVEVPVTRVRRRRRRLADRDVLVARSGEVAGPWIGPELQLRHEEAVHRRVEVALWVGHEGPGDAGRAVDLRRAVVPERGVA